MLKEDVHKRALEQLEELVDLDHVAECEALHNALAAGDAVEYLPCRVGMSAPEEWPTYSFTECWHDIEKNFVSALADAVTGRGWRRFHARCDAATGAGRRWGTARASPGVKGDVSGVSFQA